MTGGQDPKGGLSVDEISRIMVAQGVKEIIITTDDVRKYRRLKLPNNVSVWDRSRVVEAQDVLAGVDGVTVLYTTRRVQLNCGGCGNAMLKLNQIFAF